MKTARTTNTSETTVDQVRFLLTWFSVFFAALLWLTFASVLLRHGHFHVAPPHALPLFLLIALIATLSIALHFFHMAKAEWDAFPYWLDESAIRRKPLILSVPNLFTGILLLGWHLSSLTIGAVLSLALLEVAIYHFVPRLGELFARWLRRPLANRKSLLLSEAPVSPPFAPFADSPSAVRFVPETDTIRLHPEEFPILGAGINEDIGDDEESEPLPPDDLLVSQNRCLNSDGSEREEGWFRVPFRSGQTVSICHLSFCPPFRTRPKLQLFQLEGDEIQIAPTMVEPFGARIEIKRSSADTPCGGSIIDRSVRVCFFADESESTDDRNQER